MGQLESAEAGRSATMALGLAVPLLVGCSSDPATPGPARTCPDRAAQLSEALAQGPFAPSEQTPLYEKGHILPPNSLPCIPVSTGVPQNECNHHGSTVAALGDGTMAALWYHGEEEKSLDSRLVWSRRAPGAASWTAPEVVFDDPDLSDGNATLWEHEDGTLFVFFVTIMGSGWDETHVRLMQSTDSGASWSSPVTLRDQYCWNVRHRPLRLRDGQLLLPLYQECLALPTFMRSSDDFATWDEDPEPSLTEHAGQIQPALIGPPAGATEPSAPIYAITRDGTLTHRIHRMQSDDGGRTWTTSEPIGLPNSGTSVDWVRLANDHVVVVFNNSPDRRFPLSVALSLDDGDTFVAVRDIDAECPSGDCSYAYPSIAQSQADGTLWVTYSHGRETIGYVQFNEAWLAASDGATADIRCSATEMCHQGVCLRGCTTADDCHAGELCHEGACRIPCDTGPGCEAGVCAPDSLSRCDGGS